MHNTDKNILFNLKTVQSILTKHNQATRATKIKNRKRVKKYE